MRAIAARRSGIVSTAIGLALVVTTAAFAGDAPSSIEALAVQAANTPAQHESLAAYFREKAAKARAEIIKHKAMQASYVSRSNEGTAGMRAHCDQLIQAADQEARAYDGMASAEEAAAKAK